MKFRVSHHIEAFVVHSQSAWKKNVGPQQGAAIQGSTAGDESSAGDESKGGSSIRPLSSARTDAAASKSATKGTTKHRERGASLDSIPS